MKVWLLMAALIMMQAASAKAACARLPDFPAVRLCHFSPGLLGADENGWRFVQRHLDSVTIYINTIAFIIPQEDLKRTVELLKRRGIEIGIECGYFDWQTTEDDFTRPNPKRITDTVRKDWHDRVGEETALAEIRKIKPLLEAGGVPAYLNLDGPIRRMMHPGNDARQALPPGFSSMERAAKELADYMATWRRAFPGIRFNVITNFPNWGWKGEPAYWEGAGMFYGDYLKALDAMDRVTRKRGIPLNAVVADYPYEYFAGVKDRKPWIELALKIPASPGAPQPSEIDWKERLLDLEREVKKRGLHFELLLNSEAGGAAGGDMFTRKTLEYLDEYLAAGGTPSGIQVQTWYREPARVTPETDPATFTGCVRRVIIELNHRLTGRQPSWWDSLR